MTPLFRLLAAIALVAVVGCSKFEEPTAPNSPVPEPPTASIAADPMEVAPLEDVMLTVESSNADICVIGPPGLPMLNGEILVQPALTTIYYFSCVGPGGQAVDSVMVRVVVPPVSLALDSVEFGLNGFICDGDCGSSGPTERLLGVFAVPEFLGVNARVLDSLVTVRVEIELSGESQKDEAFAVGRALPPPEGRDWIDHTPGCPVVPDDPSLGQGLVTVGAADIGVGTFAYFARHAILFNCYGAVDGYQTGNSIHFKAIRFVFWREDR